jgi:hypothetical protein
VFFKLLTEKPPGEFETGLGQKYVQIGFSSLIAPISTLLSSQNERKKVAFWEAGRPSERFPLIIYSFSPHNERKKPYI